MSDSTTPVWLKDIALVTFDCFGTLVDWRAGMEKVEIRSDEDFREFERRCLKIQESDRHMSYGRLLKDVISEMRPNLRRAIVGLFADDFGRLPCFADSPRALSSLKQLVKVGVLSNSDANHQLDVMNTLRVAWDVCITSQDIRAYKPTDRAWDAIARMAVARTAVSPETWLHVSAFGNYDLQPARARRLRTCHVKRPGGDERASADLVVNDLLELNNLIEAAKDGPLLLQIRNTANDSETFDRLRTWLSTQQLNKVRAVDGVTDARLLESDGVLVEQYTFGGQREHETYKDAFAAEHAGDVKLEFGSAVTREQSVLRVRGRA